MVMMLLVASLAIMTIVSNSAFAARIHFKNKAECIDYVIHGAYVVRNHASQSLKVSKQVAKKLCAEY